MNLFVEMYKYLIDTFDLFKLYQNMFLCKDSGVNIINAQEQYVKSLFTKDDYFDLQKYFKNIL